MKHLAARSGRGLARLAAGIILAIGVLTFGAAVWPHNEVRVSGEAVLLSPPTIGVGETVTFTRAEFCNDGVDTTVSRWADYYIDGERVASFSLPPVQFFTRGEPVCFRPSSSEVVLPNYVPPGHYRLRLVTSWEPGGLATRQQVETFSPFFTVEGTAP